MCGIVGAIAERNVSPILIEGLKRLEYRGYDSAGIAVFEKGDLRQIRKTGKVAVLEQAVNEAVVHGTLGIAHTRWATHGAPSDRNAHPHLSDHIAVVHNGIIENYAELKAALVAEGYHFASETDTEVVAHLLHKLYARFQTEINPLLVAAKQLPHLLKGAYALGIISSKQPDDLIAIRAGSPLVVGLGIGENFIGSDQLALLPVTHKFIYLEENDIVHLTRAHVHIYQGDRLVSRSAVELDITELSNDKGPYKHYMLKEIHEQPDAISRTLSSAIDQGQLKDDFLQLGGDALKSIEHIQIIACGTSYHAGLVAKYWFERIIQKPCAVEIASEFRYREPVILPKTLIITISQSGETADTLAALRYIKANTPTSHQLTFLAICNVATATLIRESDVAFLTEAGAEIGVASTKAFTTQLVALFLHVLKLGVIQQKLTTHQVDDYIHALWQLPQVLKRALDLDAAILELSKRFVEKHHALFLGRGAQFAIALEGALKLKEISYIHAEGYAAGELKHGPLALVDNDMPVVILAPHDGMLDKLKSNMEEVKARGGELFVMTSEAERTLILSDVRQHVLYLPTVHAELSPLLYSIPVQLLSYHVAVLRGTDVDQPRNLAKSVTVE